MYRLLTISLCCISAAIALIAVAGAILHYSPVPFWDMWDGTLNFVMDFNDGNHDTLWAQHNEHRFVLSRLLFLLDENVFNGTGAFLVVVNYVLVLAAAAIFWRVLLLLNRNHISDSTIHIAALCTGALLFLWTQEENLTWAFQSQFFLAQLLPLAALLSLSLSGPSGTRGLGWFGLACILGFLSVGTMANGLLALPLLTVLAIMLRLPIWRVASLAILSVAAFWLYFIDYARPPAHGSIITSFLQSPFETILFTLVYLGSPGFRLFGGGMMGGAAAGLLGTVFVLLAGIASAFILRRGRNDPIRVALIVFIAYIGGTALATAGGRVEFGLAAAVASRYTTPTLMAWVALVCIYSPRLLNQFSAHNPERNAILMLVNTVALGFLGFQLRALHPDEDLRQTRSTAALAIELGAEDSDYINTIYPMPSRALAIGQRAATRNAGIFGQYPYRDLSDTIGHPSEEEGKQECRGHVDQIEALGDMSAFARVRGWQFNMETRRTPRIVQFVNEEKIVVGVALTGALRPDLAAAVDTKAEKAGYVGYVRVSALGKGVVMIGSSAGCYTPGVL